MFGGFSLPVELLVDVGANRTVFSAGILAIQSLPQSLDPPVQKCQFREGAKPGKIRIKKRRRKPMMSIRIKTRLESDTLVLPELRSLVGKTVEIRVTEAEESAIDRMLDADYHADCEADTSPEVSLADVRSALASIAGDMTADFIAERDER